MFLQVLESCIILVMRLVNLFFFSNLQRLQIENQSEKYFAKVHPVAHMDNSHAEVTSVHINPLVRGADLPSPWSVEV